MNVLFKAAVAGVTGSVIALLLKRSAPELGFALNAAITLLAAVLAAELLLNLLLLSL